LTPQHDLIVVGAGAAGLWAAARAAERGRDVLVLEKTPRTGTKVLASGGSRCNLTTALGATEAARAFGKAGARFLKHAFRVLPPAAVRERFHQLGVATLEERFDKIFPASGRARDVRDALEGWTRGAGAAIRCNAPAVGVAREGEAWRVAIAGGESVSCRTLFLCPGGQSYARTGTTGDGYAWLEALGLPLVRPAPALVPLTSPAPWVRALSGIALPDVEVRLLDHAGKLAARRPRPVLFTHRGVSGPGAMDVSEAVAREPDAGWSLVLDLVPDVPREGLRERFLAREDATSLANVLTRGFDTPVPRRVVDTLLASVAANAGASEPPWKLARTTRHDLIEALKGWPIPIDGTLGYDAAEVTAGGLALSAVDPGSMRVRDAPGLHVFGELLDLTGPIGGFHFQSAFACAEVAAAATTAD